MKPGRELDALVAEKVMGCRVKWQSASVSGPYCGCNCGPDDDFHFEVGPHSDPNRMDENLKDYSTDIAAAWEVVERFEYFTIARSRRDGERCLAEFETDPGKFFSAEAETIPHAICLAALKAVERKNER